MLMSLLFAVLVLHFLTNQVATGLALTILGIGFSAYFGLDYVGLTLDSLPPLAVPLLSEIPVLGPILFRQDPLVYASLAAFAATSYFLSRTRGGLILRAIGESPGAAHNTGLAVRKVRYAAVLFGGGMTGVAGAYLSIVYTPLWVENMTAGRGWIALALVVFATWKPTRVLIGAYLFGGVTILQFHAQAFGFEASSHLLSMLPYLATILVLVLISRERKLIRINAPASLGKPFHPGA
jgi:simple sugar transport system permease protein